MPISTPNYKTTAVAIDAISASTSINGQYELVKVSNEPCIVRFEILENNANMTRTPIDVIADITWQGYEVQTYRAGIFDESVFGKSTYDVKG